jgi:predicted DCC family thiol-disulfide oxidoreductase YuxK
MAIVLFDGVCNLCNASVQWVLQRDRHNHFQFASLQSETGRRLLEQHGLEPGQLDTVVLIADGKAYTHSTAAIEVMRRLGGLWSVAAVLKMVPRPLRDAVYAWVGRNRYRWYGRTEVCWLPRPEWKEKFL